MSVVVHARDFAPQDLAAMRTQLAADLVQLAAGVSGGQDIGTLLGQLDTPALTADTYATDVYSTWSKLGPQQAFGLYGFASLSKAPILDEITAIAGPYTLAIVELDQTYANTADIRCFFVPPITWAPNEHVRLDMLSHAGGSAHADPFEWMALIAEIESTVVKPRRLMPAGPGGGPGRVPGSV